MTIKNYELYLAAKPTTTYTLKDSKSGTGSDRYFGYTYTPIATSFSASATYTPRRITVSLKKTSSPTGNIQAYIYSDSGGSPSAVLATSTTVLNIATLTTSYVDYDFDIALVDSSELTSGTTYWVALTGYGWSGNYPQWQYNASGSFKLYGYTTSWQALDTLMDGNFKIYSLE